MDSEQSPKSFRLQHEPSFTTCVSPSQAEELPAKGNLDPKSEFQTPKLAIFASRNLTKLGKFFMAFYFFSSLDTAHAIHANNNTYFVKEFYGVSLGVSYRKKGITLPRMNFMLCL